MKYLFIIPIAVALMIHSPMALTKDVAAKQTSDKNISWAEGVSINLESSDNSLLGIVVKAQKFLARRNIEVTGDFLNYSQVLYKFKTN